MMEVGRGISCSFRTDFVKTILSLFFFHLILLQSVSAAASGTPLSEITSRNANTSASKAHDPASGSGLICNLDKGTGNRGLSQRNSTEGENKIPQQNNMERLYLRDSQYIKRLYYSHRATVVDVRKKNKYVRNHIEGSINVPLHLLVTKTFLKNKNVILIGNGLDDNEIVKYCSRLSQHGFNKVVVLKGGIRSWVNNISSLKGSKNGLLELQDKMISPRDFEMVKGKLAWILVTGKQTKNQSSLIKKLFAGHSVMPMNEMTSNNKISLVINNNAKQYSGDINYLVLSNSGKQYRTLYDKFSSIRGVNDFYLSGGIEGYDSFIKNHRDMLTNKNRIPKKKPMCGSM